MAEESRDPKAVLETVQSPNHPKIVSDTLKIEETALHDVRNVEVGVKAEGQVQSLGPLVQHVGFELQNNEKVGPFVTLFKNSFEL